MAYKKSNPNGQAAMAASEPVVIASDQSAVPVSGTVTANIGTVATLATAAKQDTGNTSVASIDTKTPALGQALAAASVPAIAFAKAGNKVFEMDMSVVDKWKAVAKSSAWKEFSERNETCAAMMCSAEKIS